MRKLIPKGRLARGVILVTGGTVFAQGATILVPGHSGGFRSVSGNRCCFAPIFGMGPPARQSALDWEHPRQPFLRDCPTRFSNTCLRACRFSRASDPARAVPEAGGTADTANKKYYSTVHLSRDHTHSWIRKHAKGQVFLDYACGNGDNAIKAALAGASLAVGVDISSVSIQNCRRRAAEAGVSSNTFFVQGDCENTGLPSNSINAAIGDGILHHLDLSLTFPELRRIMRPGGRYLAREALNYNPVIKLYRWLTPNMRTEWEKRHILSLRDLRFAKHFLRYAIFAIGTCAAF